MKNKIFTLWALLLIFSITACTDEDDPVVPNEEELITTLKYTLTPQAGGTPIVLTFTDLDGEGGNAPTLTRGILAANTTYTGKLELLNESEVPAENITKEIEEEDEEHQFFFSTTITGLTITYDDKDGDGNPTGLKTILKTTNAGSGKIKVILRHEPDKKATGVTTGDITNAGGETDIEVEFDVTVQ